MGAYKTGPGALLFDPNTGAFRGVLDEQGRETLVPALSSAAGSFFQGSTIKKIQAAMAQAKQRNPFVNPPWVATPAWAASTTYPTMALGTIVQNGGNLYELQTVGTTASSGGPTGTGNGGITDGTCTWFYVGPVKAPASTTPAPTLTWPNTAGGGLSTAVPAVGGNSGSFFYSGGNPVAIGSGLCFPFANLGTSIGNIYLAVGGSGTGYLYFNQQHATVTFDDDAPEIFIPCTTTNYQQLVVEVDGQFLQLGTMYPAATATGLLINWNGERKKRRYRVWLAPGNLWTGTYHDSGSTCWADANPNRFRLVVSGDSLSIDSGNHMPFLGRSWPDTLSYLIGCDDVYNNAVGGTGFIANNSGSDTTYIQRLPQVTALNPDVHIIFGHRNDTTGAYTSAQQQAAILAYLQAFTAACPNALVIMTGTMGTVNGAAAMAPYEANIQAVVQQLNNPNVIFVPVSTATVPWFNGTGSIASPSGSGNGDVYVINGPHCQSRGIDYTGAQLFNAWASFFNQF